MRDGLILIVLVVVGLVLYVRSGRRSAARARTRQRAMLRRRVDQAAGVSPDQMVASAAEYLRAELQNATNSNAAWRVAKEASAALVSAADNISEPTKGRAQ